MAYKSADEIASIFFAKRPEGGWLTEKQTAWLYGQACREAHRKLLMHGTPCAMGTYGDRQWHLYVAHNNCGRLGFVNEHPQQEPQQNVETRDGDIQVIHAVNGNCFLASTYQNGVAAINCQRLEENPYKDNSEFTLIYDGGLLFIYRPNGVNQ